MASCIVPFGAIPCSFEMKFELEALLQGNDGILHNLLRCLV
jgi:hypothetical protein